MDTEEPEREEYGSSAHSTPQESKSFTDYAKDKFDSAGRELRRRLPMAGQLGARLMHPRRLLLHSAPTRHCDVVLALSKGVYDTALLWLLQKLRAARPRLRVCVRQHPSSQCSALYITADDAVLLQTAEEVHLPKLLKPEYGGGYKEFTVRDMHCFQNGSSASELLSSSERGALVKHVLESVRAEESDTDALLPDVALRPGQSIVPACISSGMVASMFPLHDRKALDTLRRKWVKTLFSPQPLDDISEYFGVKIAMYFAWLGHYTRALVLPAIVGFVFWVWIGTANEYWRDVAHMLFALFNIMWAGVYLETWKRFSNVLAYRWGTWDQRDDLLLEPRPQFRGAMRVSPVTNRLEPHYPAWRRRLWRHLVSCPCILMCVGCTALVTFSLLRTQDWWESHIGYCSWIPRALLAILIAVEEEVYARIARWLNDKENYRLETKYENHLIVKIALFQFVNSFMSLFYIAFYLQDMDKLKEQLAVLLITRQIINNVKESAVPYLIENVRLAKICLDVFGAVSPSKLPSIEQLSDSFNEAQDASADGERRDSEPLVGPRLIHQAELESQLFEYDGTFSEYLEMLTQLGHVLLFSSAFPLAALCALLNNLLEIRADAFKLCHVARRPFPQRVKSIGTWQHAMEAMVLVAVLVNCLIGLSGPAHRMLPSATRSQTVLRVVACEHVILLAALALKLAIPPIPGWLAEEMAKVEFQRREAIKNAHAPLSEGVSQEDIVGRSARSTPRAVSPLRTPTPDTPRARKQDVGLIAEIPPFNSTLRTLEKPLMNFDEVPPPKSPKIEKRRPADVRGAKIANIPDIPPFRPKAASITEQSTGKEPSVTASLMHLQQDVSPTKPLRRKEAPLSLLGVRGLRADEPLHRSAHCIPHPTTIHQPLLNPLHKEISVGGRGSEPELNTGALTSGPSTSDNTSASEDEKPKGKGTSRAKALLVKRVRSVAVFSLGLRKAREAAAAADKHDKLTPHSPDPKPVAPPSFGGELSLIPIEQLIQVEDVKLTPQ